MKELLNDILAVIESAAMGAWEITGDLFRLAMIEDPFLRGAATALVAVALISKRKAVMSVLDRIPIVGGVLVYVPRKIDEGFDFVMDKLKLGLGWMRDKLAPIKAWVSKADKDLRE